MHIDLYNLKPQENILNNFYDTEIYIFSIQIVIFIQNLVAQNQKQLHNTQKVTQKCAGLTKL